MEKQELVVPVRVSPAMFHEFGMFDAFSRQKRWRGPLLFALIFAASAAACFIRSSQVPGAALLGAVLLAVGLGLPAAYVLSFSLSLKKQERALAQNPGAIAYTLRLGETGFSVLQGEEKMEHTWDDVALACRLDSCMCLYVGPRRAYLLPGETGDRHEQAVWALICRRLPPHKQFCRKG